jgi:hypothetical protein
MRQEQRLAEALICFLLSHTDFLETTLLEVLIYSYNHFSAFCTRFIAKSSGASRAGVCAPGRAR